jgi:uncharacterized membrane protein YecN with MAPEG domain
MSAIAAACLYAGLNILLLLVLSFLVVRQRQAHKVAFGDGGVEALTRAIRVHGNATEYIPPALVGLVALALAGGSPIAVHVGGVVLTVGRLLHAQGFSGASGTSVGRFAGQLATYLALAWIAVACVITAFTG